MRFNVSNFRCPFKTANHNFSRFGFIRILMNWHEYWAALSSNAAKKQNRKSSTTTEEKLNSLDGALRYREIKLFYV